MSNNTESGARSMSMTTELAQTKELAFLMSERFTMNPISCKHLNEAWREAFPDEVAVAKRMLALVDALEARDKQIADLKEAFRIALSAAGISVAVEGEQ
ncbi:hypothetical protein ACJJVG_09825 [Pseudocitrobacter faecalis]|uniref:hypothetical protein n=1 Tax=Pseudocitrobacter faecalis TaxID=1398493 RepID=UPI00389AE340